MSNDGFTSFKDFEDSGDNGGPARTSDPLSSHEALDDEKLSSRICHNIMRHALAAGNKGITINECAALMPEYKAWSVSPKFSHLVRKGLLVRLVIGYKEPSRRWPAGKEIQETRIDPKTHRACTVNYHHRFAPKKQPKALTQQSRLEYDAG